METEFATTTDRLLRRWLQYIDGFEALCKAPMCRPRLQGKFQPNSPPVGVLALHMIGGISESILVRSGHWQSPSWHNIVSPSRRRAEALLSFSESTFSTNQSQF